MHMWKLEIVLYFILYDEKLLKFKSIKYLLTYLLTVN